MMMISEKISQVFHLGLKRDILLPHLLSAGATGMNHHTWVLLLVLVCETVQLLSATAVKLYYLKQLLRSITLSSFLLL